MRTFTAAAAVIAAMSPVASAQYTLSDDQVPFQGGNIFKSNDSAVANYTFSYKIPFEPTQYGGYYYWAVNNNTVAGANFTSPNMPDGYDYGESSSLTMNPYFLVSEGTPKTINTTKLFSNCAGSRSHARDTRCEGKVKKIVHVIFENEVYDWTMSSPWWRFLATKGKSLTNFHAITHPSLANYAAIVAGDFFGLAHEDFYNVNATTIYDLLDDKQISYATYNEWYNAIETNRGPDDCNNYITNGPIDNTNPTWGSQTYRRLDVPALLFTTYTGSYDRCSKMYDANNTFYTHVMDHSLPEYTYFVPDMLHNGHDPESNSDYVH